MGDSLSFIDGLMVRLTGPMNFRFLLQPLMALFFAFRDGRKDAQEGRAPFFWAMFTDPENRRYVMRSGWKSIGKVFVIAIILDLAFQYFVLHGFQIRGGAVIAGVILAIVPYLALRGPVNRLMHRKGKEENQ